MEVGSLIFMKTEQKEKPMGFDNLGISPSILAALQNLGITNPTPIQHKAIPIAIVGGDLIGIAQTGTGKTFAFGVPMIEQLGKTNGKGLVLLPTRELALQVEENLRLLGEKMGLRTAALIGGEAISKQVAQIRRNPHIVVATPGRLNDALKRGIIRLSQVKVLVLDEADMMLDMGFLPQVEEILSQVPKDRQTMLFSATMPTAIARLAATHMKLPVSIEVAPAGSTAEKVEQEMYVMRKDDKFMHLEKILKDHDGSVLIFARTRFGAKHLTQQLGQIKISVAEIHSNRSFEQRKAALAGFKSGKYRVLVATDIAARGIDVKGIELVINYDLPDASEDYVHRIGRTGRAGKPGKAISFAVPSQYKDIKSIERLIKKEIALTKFAELNVPISRNSKDNPRRRFGSYGVASKFRPSGGGGRQGNRRTSR